MLLESWRDFEVENEDEKCIEKVKNLMPKRVKKRRRIEQDEDAPGKIYKELIYLADSEILLSSNAMSLEALTFFQGLW